MVVCVQVVEFPSTGESRPTFSCIFCPAHRADGMWTSSVSSSLGKHVGLTSSPDMLQANVALRWNFPEASLFRMEVFRCNHDGIGANTDINLRTRRLQIPSVFLIGITLGTIARDVILRHSRPLSIPFMSTFIVLVYKFRRSEAEADEMR